MFFRLRHLSSALCSGDPVRGLRVPRFVAAGQFGASLVDGLSVCGWNSGRRMYIPA